MACRLAIGDEMIGELMRYFGSKTSTLEGLRTLIGGHVSGGTMCDPFGGIGTVGGFFKSMGFRVHTGDILLFAHFFQVARLHYSELPSFDTLKQAEGWTDTREVVDALCCTGELGSWFANAYAGDRLFFSSENAMRVDAAWRQIIAWRERDLVSSDEHAYLMASLINSMDAVANTAGTYYAHLKTLQAKARRPFVFRLLKPVEGPLGKSMRSDALELVQQRSWDLVYLDPPYNGRSYASYYHLPETIALGHTPGAVTGKAGMPSRHKPASGYNSRLTAEKEFTSLLEATDARVLVFHYSDDGILPPELVRELLSARGKVTSHCLEALGYSTVAQRRRVTHRAYVVVAA